MTSLQAYLDAGGEQLDDDRKKSSILKLLPWDIQERVLWDFDDYKSCDQLVSWIKSKVRITTSWRPGAAAAAAHVVEELDEQGQQELQDLGRDADQEEVNAVYRRGQARFAQKKWPSKRPDGRVQSAARAPPRAEGEMTCPNCLEKGHKKEDCKKPMIDVNERKCFLCKKPGHRAFQCPDKPVNSVEDAPGRPKTRDTMCIEDSEGFVPIQRRKSQLALTGSSHICSHICSHKRKEATTTMTRRPMPMERRLADFVKVSNNFEVLASLEAAGVEAERATITTLCHPEPAG